MIRKSFSIAICVFLIGLTLNAQNPKREIRATWLTTVWQTDWPRVTVPAPTGSNEAARESARNQQKTGMTTILDRLEKANFNTVFFQIRGMSDAFYNSKYEPWSQYLSSTRGADPGWDPLQFVLDEAHARGMEVHAWINPYRYSTAAASHGNLPTDYPNTNPNWLIDYGPRVDSKGKETHPKILNPGMPEVRQRICDVVEDILVKYDVDGIVFDDYFYVSGTKDNMDQAQYDMYNPDNLGRSDWRRANVNLMVKEVQARINSVKPHVSFGISPAGVASSSAAVAAGHGIPPCPSGSDWQYSDIFSDPVAWLKEGTVDYISPQVYWTIGSDNDYSKISPWWAKVANLFGRQYYSSNYSTFLGTELSKQIIINRDADLNGTTGIVFFRTADLTIQTINKLKEVEHATKALNAVYGWKSAPSQGIVDNISLSGQKLSWTYAANDVRYSIYAIPNANSNDADIFFSPKYLQGISYSKNFTLPSGISASTHKIAVSVYDMYGHEYAPRVMGEAVTTATQAQLTYPANGQDVALPAFFIWQPVAGASHYIWELAEDAGFTKPIDTRETLEPNFNSGLVTSLKDDTDYYWRVRTVKPNADVTTSAVYKFQGTKFKITSPEDGADKITLTPTFTWTKIGDGANYTLEISDKADFSSITYSTETQATTATVVSGKLSPSTNYFARVQAIIGEFHAISERVDFRTEDTPIDIPVVIAPTDGATVYGSEIELKWQAQDSKGFRAELGTSSSFPKRGTKLLTVDPFVYSATFTGLDDGTYYLRVRARDGEGLTEPSDYITVNLVFANSVPQVHENSGTYSYQDDNGNQLLVISSNTAEEVMMHVYTIDGMLVKEEKHTLNAGKNIINLDWQMQAKGMYIVQITNDNLKETIKIHY